MSAARRTPETEPRRNLGRTVLLYGIGVVVAIAVALFLSALLPRWWAQRMGNLIDGRITFGSVLGLGLGLVCTVVPLLFARWAWNFREKRAPALFLLALAGICAFPNLMALWVVVGTSSAAHAGERILDVDGPGYRWGTFFGALLGAVVFGFVAYRGWQRERERRRIEQERRDRERRHDDAIARTTPHDER